MTATVSSRVRFWRGRQQLLPLHKPLELNGGTGRSYEYRKILNALYGAIRGWYNSNVVIAAGPAPNSKKGKSISPLDFTRRALL